MVAKAARATGHHLRIQPKGLKRKCRASAVLLIPSTLSVGMPRAFTSANRDRETRRGKTMTNAMTVTTNPTDALMAWNTLNGSAAKAASNPKAMCQPLLAGAIRNSRACDITGDPRWMAEANALVMEAYGRFAGADAKISDADMREALSEDPYAVGGKAHTIAVIVTDPETGAREMAATIRVVVSNVDHDLPPIEAMQLVCPLECWPHRTAGVSDRQIAEFGRFVIAPKYRTAPMKAAGVHAFLTRSMYEPCMSSVAGHDVRAIYAIMPKYMSDLCIRGGLRIREIPSRLRFEDNQASRLFREFSNYWVKCSPKLWEFLPLYV